MMRTTWGSDNCLKVLRLYKSFTIVQKFYNCFKVHLFFDGPWKDPGLESSSSRHRVLNSNREVDHLQPWDVKFTLWIHRFERNCVTCTNFVTQIQEREIFHLTPHVVFHSLRCPIVIWESTSRSKAAHITLIWAGGKWAEWLQKLWGKFCCFWLCFG